MTRKEKLTGKILGYAAIVGGTVSLAITALGGIVEAMHPHPAILVMAIGFGTIGIHLVYVGIHVVAPKVK